VVKYKENRSMPKLIEIIGPPGVGKTFLSQKLQSFKKKNKQIFFHSSDIKNFKKFKRLNIFMIFIIKIRVISIIANFFFHFNKRIFLKKIYKRKFFLRVILLMYRHLLSIEMLKKNLSKDQYLIMEPGVIMYFIQDYFYIKKKLSLNEIKIFNKIYVKVDFIICLDCDYKTQIKRLNLRNRGMPQRMSKLNKKEIYETLKKANQEIQNYISNSKNLKKKIIYFNTSEKIKDLKKKLNKYMLFQV
jgi:deoxyadenosine/deoxycytidine kinase